MGSTKKILENKDSLSTLISPISPSSTNTEDFSSFVPPVSTRIYPYANLPMGNKVFSGSGGGGIKRGSSSSRNGASLSLSICKPLIWFGLGVIFSSLTFILVRLLQNVEIVRRNEKGNSTHSSIIQDGENIKCVTPICLQAAARFVSRYNPDEDPCEEFYKFSCGTFVEKNEIPDDSFMRSTLQEMQDSILVDIKKLIDQPGNDDDNIAIKKARHLYASCMHNSFRLSSFEEYKSLPIYQVLTKNYIGTWPILQGYWNSSEYNLERLLAQLFSHQVQNIFEIYISPDEIDSNVYLLQFYKGDASMPKSFFLNTTNPDYVKYIRSYKRLLLESVLILSHGTSSKSDVEAILEFETEFAKLVQNSKCLFDGFDLLEGVEEDYGRVTLSDIGSRIPQINWIELIQNIFDNLNIERNVSEDMYVYFHCSEFFPGLVQLIEQTDKRTVTNYLIWRFVYRYMPFLGNKFLQIWMEFMKDVPVANEEKLYLSRWKQCASIVNDGFGYALSKLYVEKYYDMRTKEIVENLIHYLKKAFRNVILEQSWLSESFKQDIIDKLMKMGYKIGYPSFIMDSESLSKEFEGLEFDDNDYFLLNILKLRRYEVFKEIRKVSQPVDKERDWLVQPLVANAFHLPTANEIVLPLGLLRYPMFSVDYPMYLQFSNLGIVIAHEMVHAFDHQGRHYDKDGNITSWWPEDVMNAFKEQAICFIDQYAKFKMPMVDQYVNGNLTLADNICDNAALRHAWLGYQYWVEDNGKEKELPGINLTIPQIFYITYGQIWCEVLNKEGFETYLRDPHSPGNFRTIGVAQNNKDFASIFQCKENDPMNPTEKCVLWS